MGDGRPYMGSVGMGIHMGIPMEIPVGMGWVWGLKCHPHGSPAILHWLRLPERVNFKLALMDTES